jgi:hypothetical protein
MSKKDPTTTYTPKTLIGGDTECFQLNETDVALLVEYVNGCSEKSSHHSLGG